MFSDDGKKFNPKALATLAKWYMELMVSSEPNMSRLQTEAFLSR